MTNRARIAALALALAIAQTPHALAQMAGGPSAATVTSPDGTQMSLNDPAVKAGRFVYEIAPWWGPKSLRY